MPETVEDNVACRICMDPKDNYVSLFSHDLSKKVKEVADVQVEKDDGLPDSICTECEQDLEKCYEFRIKVQVSDKKFRSNLKFSQVQIEECNIKEERFVDYGNSDNMDDKDSVSMDDDHYDEPDVSHKSTEDVEEADPLNHVVVVEEKEGKMEVPGELLSQDNAMNVEPQVEKIEEVALDPLVCMKEEAEIMDVDSNQRDPFGASSSVRSSPNSLNIPPTPSSSGIEYHFILGISQEPEFASKNKEKPSTQDGKAQGVSTAVRNQQPNPSMLIPHLGLNSDLLIPPYVDFTAAASAAVQSYIKDQVKHTVNATALEKTSPKSKIRGISKSKVSAASCSYESSQNFTAQPITAVEDKISGVNTEVVVEINENKEASFLPQPAFEHLNREEVFCSVCNIDFGFSDLLEEHKKGSNFICRSCTAVFHNHMELENHFITHTKYICDVCKKTFYVRKDLIEHKKSSIVCNRKPMKEICKICNSKFRSKKGLQVHIEQKHPDGRPQMYACPVCDMSYKIKDHLKRHMMSNHEVFESIECDICHKIILGPEKLKLHVKVRHLQSTEVCPVCSKVLSNKFSLKHHMESHEGEEKICHICGATVKGSAAYRYHLYNHENKKASCSMCDITFNNSAERNRHYKENHMKESSTPSICELCGKEFKNRMILKNHMLTHSDVKPHHCDICGAAFKTKAILKTHSRVHSDARRFSCDSCGEGFRWKPTYVKHLQKCEFSRNRNAGSAIVN